MPRTMRNLARVVPGFRPCAACEEPKSVNAQYCFVGGGVSIICTECYFIGFWFDAAGAVVHEVDHNSRRDHRT
jgi:hypothetical protein